jgi:sulfate adenylyltransferase subunit 1
MFTGASNADLAIILIDARNGITEQTKRHSIISSILGIPHILICVNKMDLVDYKYSVFEDIKSDYLKFSKRLGLKEISFIPVSALTGDNVVKSSDNLSWFKGESLFEFLENVDIQSVNDSQEVRFQVQYVIRPQTEELHDYRGYAGSVLSGTINKGDRVQILPLDVTTTIEKIEKFEKEIQVAEEGDPIVIHLTDDLDVSRGSTIVKLDDRPITDNVIEATICWMDNKSYQKGQKLLLQQNSFRSKVSIKEVEAQLDIHTFDHVSCEETMNLNDFYKVILKTAEPISYDPYSKNRKTGSFILINENSNNTVAAGIING